MTQIDYQAELNEQQYQAVITTEGPQLVIAGAGSGKTRTLVYRVAYLVETGIVPASILLLTFTRKSAQEMMRRGSNLLDRRCMNISGGTFHSFANLILRRYSKLLGYESNFSVLDRGDCEEIVSIIRAEMGLNTKGREFPKKGTLLSIISKVTNTQLPYEDVVVADYPKYECEASLIAEVGSRYHAYKKKKNVMDYDDLLVLLLELLRENDEVRTHLSRTYQYIMVDEYQDSNRIQSQIACLLASEHGNLMVVGDDSQSIYSFRGANFRNIMDFPKIFDDCTITRLEQNYRSTQNILHFTNEIIRNAKEKFTKNLFSDRDAGDLPTFLTPYDVYDQARYIARTIERLHTNNNVALRDIAILFRSSFHTNELEMELKSRHINYEKFGGIKFTESSHIKDITALLRVMFNDKDYLSWVRFLKLFDGVGDKTAMGIADDIVEAELGFKALLQPKRISKKYGENLTKLYNTLDFVLTSDSDPISHFELILDYYRPYFEARYDDFWKRENDLDSLLQLSKQYEEIEPFLTDLTLDPPESQKAEESESDDKLTLSTIHSAKGLEWKHVFIISMNNGYLPSGRSMGTIEDIEEERRLFYVASTRAEDQLYLLSLQTGKELGNYTDGPTALSYSMFITEMDGFDTLTSFESTEESATTSNFHRIDEGQRSHAKKNKSYMNNITDYFSNY